MVAAVTTGQGPHSAAALIRMPEAGNTKRVTAQLSHLASLCGYHIQLQPFLLLVLRLLE